VLSIYHACLIRRRKPSPSTAVAQGAAGVGVGVLPAIEHGLSIHEDIPDPHAVLEWIEVSGTLDDLDDVARAYGVDVLLVADGDFTETALRRAVRTEAAERCDVLVVPRLHHFNTLARRADHIGSIPVMRIRTPNLAGPGLAIKRAFDVVVSGLALLFLAPLMGAIALAVRSEGPDVIFRQPRVGRNGRVFDVLKFRSMRPADEHESATNWSIADDDRVGPIGRILRRTSLDEIPQLWNILRGDMSLVGPRPERPHFVEQFTQQYDLYAQRHRVKAGLTGLAQVSGLRGDTSIADRARYDNYYIENWSLWMDVKIIVRTVSEVLFARGR
jgi:exopolysaccharide biosynthesis polyprenyl glycosylphosphotransferase